MRLLILILSLSLSSSALEFESDDDFVEVENPSYFSAEHDLGMMSTFEGYVGYNDSEYVPLNNNGSDVDSQYVPYEEDLEDRGFNTRLGCGSTRVVRSRSFPNRFQTNEW